MSFMQLFHGTDHIIEVPDIHIGNPHNDYGMGFYCTRIDEMAREWACKKNTDGFVNIYSLDTERSKNTESVGRESYSPQLDRAAAAVPYLQA